MSAGRGKQKPRAELSGVMLEYIGERGSLKGFPALGGGKFALMQVAIEQGIVVWNK
jgi:hypothetical protein